MRHRIADLIDVPPVKTVIRLEEGRTHASAITSSFVCTADIASHLSVLGSSLMGTHGCGGFIEGDFGSGKSHLLAALSVWLGDLEGGALLSEANQVMARCKASGRRFLPVDLSLVDFRSTTPLERIVTRAMETAMERQGIPVALSPLRRFAAHLASLLAAPQLAAAFTRSCGVEAGEVEQWFATDPRHAYSAGTAFLREQGMASAELLIDERHEVFSRALETVSRAGFDGMVLLIDELSEFFRSKPDAASLNEDARTLQLLGEIATGHPLWIIAAVQESIERTGDIASMTFRKIKDRYPLRLHLSTLHIRDLIAKRLVRKREGADEVLLSLHEEYRRHFPSFTCPFDLFRNVYPLHPQTLALLEGLGELFSQHRGIVDFVHARIGGDPSRGIEGILERDAGELLAPDSLYEHFAPRLAEISSFYEYPRTIVPHLDECISRVLEDEPDRELARRLVRILVLYTIHPCASPPSARLLAQLGGCMLSPSDPDANAQFVARVILDPLCMESRFVRRTDPSSGDPLDATYTISTREDHIGNLQARVRQAVSEIRGNDSRILLEPLGTLVSDLSWPGPEVLQGPAVRTVLWRQSSRRVAVAFLLPDGGDPLARQLETLLGEGSVDCALVLTTGPTPFALHHTQVWRFCPQGANQTVLIEYFAALTVRRDLNPANPAHAPLITPAAELSRRLEPGVRQALIELLYRGTFDAHPDAVDAAALQLKKFDRLLETAAALSLDQRYPEFRRIAPRSPVPLSVWQRLFDDFVIPGSLTLSEARACGILDPLETLAAPLGLVELKSGSYRLAPALGDHPFLAYTLSLLRPSGPTPMGDVLRELMTGPWGVMRECAEFLLATLAQSGSIALLRGGRTQTLDLMPLSKVGTCDAIVPGELIARGDRETLALECPFLAPSGGWPSFGLRQQRDAWQTLVRFKQTTETLLIETRDRMAGVSGYTAFSSFDFAAIREKGDALARVIAEVKVSYAAREGLERFLAAWRTSGLNAADIEMLRKTHRFLTRCADRFVHIAHYMRHPAIEAACALDTELQRHREGIALMLEDPLSMIVPDECAQAATNFDLFREIYTPFYSRAHHAWYEAQRPPRLNKSSERMLRLFEQLCAIEQLERPAPLAPLQELLHPQREQSCTRRVDEELLRSPACACGFLPGQTGAVRPVNHAELFDATFEAYQAILAAPGILEPLTSHAYALRDMEPAASTRIEKLCAALRDPSTAAGVVLDLLDAQTVSELARALSGSMKVQRLPITPLLATLAGKKLTPQRARQLFDEWVGPTHDPVLLSIDAGASPAVSPDDTLAWWPRLHPHLLGSTAPQTDPRPVRMLEQALNERYPARELARELTRLDAGELTTFLASEPFHTAAIRQAWSLLTLSLLDKAFSLPGNLPRSRHVLPETAAAIDTRLDAIAAFCADVQAPFPRRLCARLNAARFWYDEWSSDRIRKGVDTFIKRLADQGSDWLESLPTAEPLNQDDMPVVVLLDGVGADVWIQSLEHMEPLGGNPQSSWLRLSCKPATLDSIAALFGLEPGCDPAAGLAQRGIGYQNLYGNEELPASDHLEPPRPGAPLLVRLSLFDKSAHGGSMQLSAMAPTLAHLLSRHLPSLMELCLTHNRPLVLTTDHGLSWNQGTLTHGKGGVYEEAVFRVRWGTQDFPLATRLVR